MNENFGVNLAKLSHLPLFAECPWTIDNCEFPSDDGYYLAKSISEGTCIAVNDGSYKEETKTATSAFLIEGPDKEIH